MKVALLVCVLVISVFAEPAIYFKETFEDGGMLNNSLLYVIMLSCRFLE